LNVYVYKLGSYGSLAYPPEADPVVLIPFPKFFYDHIPEFALRVDGSMAGKGFIKGNHDILIAGDTVVHEDKNRNDNINVHATENYYWHGVFMD